MTTTATVLPPRDGPVLGGGGLTAHLPAPIRFGARAVTSLWGDGKARIGMVILAAMILVALLAPLLAPYSPTDTNFQPYLAPGATHLFGTTGNGQDVLSQMLYGARPSLLVGFAAGLFATLLAVTIGLLSGYRPGILDESLGVLTNLALVLPSLPLMIILAAYIPSHSIWTIVLVVGVTGWATGARVIRSQASTLRSRAFITSAAFSGEGVLRVVFREMLPNMTSLVAASFFGAATGAVLAEASLEVLGLGNPSTVSWGTILYYAGQQNALLTGQWLLVFAPGLAIALLAVSLTLVNFGVDSLSNPRLREK